MRQGGRFCFGAKLAVLGLGGCDAQDTGYVQIQLARPGALGASPLFLDGARLDFSRGAAVVSLQHSLGAL